MNAALLESKNVEKRQKTVIFTTNSKEKMKKTIEPRLPRANSTCPTPGKDTLLGFVISHHRGEERRGPRKVLNLVA